MKRIKTTHPRAKKALQTSKERVSFREWKTQIQQHDKKDESTNEKGICSEESSNEKRSDEEQIDRPGAGCYSDKILNAEEPSNQKGSDGEKIEGCDESTNDKGINDGEIGKPSVPCSEESSNENRSDEEKIERPGEGCYSDKIHNTEEPSNEKGSDEENIEGYDNDKTHGDISLTVFAMIDNQKEKLNVTGTIEYSQEIQQENVSTQEIMRKNRKRKLNADFQCQTLRKSRRLEEKRLLKVD
jgi:hypothetical protein